MRLLLVEDDEMLGAALREGLRGRGMTLDWVRDGRAGLAAATTEPFDLILLDLGLPQLCGLEALRTLRARRVRTPVIILTAHDAVQQRIDGLDAGADDFMLKPFDLGELAARIRAVLRRHDDDGDTTLRCGSITLDPARREVQRGGEPVMLSAREFALLEMLLRRPGQPLTRAQIEERLYGWGEEVESNTVEVFIYQLRRKLGPDLIHNIRGVGYFVRAPAHSS